MGNKMTELVVSANAPKQHVFALKFPEETIAFMTLVHREQRRMSGDVILD